jgi:hypothetical protein
MLDNVDTAVQPQGFGIIIVLNPNGRAMMTRDIELIRKILLQVQSRRDTSRRPVEIEGYDVVIVARHVEMLLNEEYLEGKMISHSGTNGFPHIAISDLSWSGHDLISTLGNDNVLAKLKQSLSPSELATLPLTIVKKVGLKVLEAYIMLKTGFSDT